MKKPRLLIEDWLPAAAIGVECMREKKPGKNSFPPPSASTSGGRAVLFASPAPPFSARSTRRLSHEVFERLLGFWGSSKNILAAQRLLEAALARGGPRIQNPHGERAFRRVLSEKDLAQAHAAAARLFGNSIVVIDPMAGGGSIPLESTRLGFRTLANQYNPVASTILEATVDHPFRFGPRLAERTRHWGTELHRRFNARMERFFPKTGVLPPHCYIFARTVPCPDTEGHPHTPLVPDWHLLKPKGSAVRVWAEPIVDKKAGTWRVRIVDNREQKARAKNPPAPTFGNGKGISLFSGQQISDEWINAKAQAIPTEIQSALYAVVFKTPGGLKFAPPTEADLQSLDEAEKALRKHRRRWEQQNLIPTERIPEGDKTREALVKGLRNWADLFAPRQLLGLGVLVEELDALRVAILKSEGDELGEAVIHLLAFSIDKFLNYNSVLGSWHSPRAVMRSVFDRHDFAFKMTFAEMAPCSSGTGLAWAIDNTTEASKNISELPGHSKTRVATLTLGSATNLPSVDDKSISAIVVDPPSPTTSSILNLLTSSTSG